MKRILFLITAITFSFRCFAQSNTSDIASFYNNSNHMEYYMHKQQYDSAMMYAKRALQYKGKLQATIYSTVAKIHFRNNEKQEGYKWLRKAIASGIFSEPGNMAFNFRRYINQADPEYTSLLAQYDSLNNLQQKDMDEKMVNTINTMFSLDQAARNFCELFNKDNIYSCKIIGQADTANVAILKKIIVTKELPFPGINNIGFANTEKFYFMLTHLYTYFDRELLLNELDKQMNNGNISNYFLANFMDKMQLNKNKHSLYGTIYNGPNYLEIDSISMVDKRREHLYMYPLYIDAEIYGVPLPAKYDKNTVIW